jgi:hypothetical protein
MGREKEKKIKHTFLERSSEKTNNKKTKKYGVVREDYSIYSRR